MRTIARSLTLALGRFRGWHLAPTSAGCDTGVMQELLNRSNELLARISDILVRL
jgi:hypothetical protein